MANNRRILVARRPRERFFSCRSRFPSQSSPETWFSAGSDDESFTTCHPIPSSPTEYVDCMTPGAEVGVQGMREYLLNQFRPHDSHRYYGYAELDQFSPILNPSKVNKQLMKDFKELDDRGVYKYSEMDKFSNEPVPKVTRQRSFSPAKPSSPGVGINDIKKHLYNEFKEHEKYRHYMNELKAPQSAIYDRNNIYRYNALPAPTTERERRIDELFTKAMYKHHYENPGLYDTVGALRNFRRKARHASNPEDVLRNFRFFDFLRAYQPTKYDLPDFTGPYIAGPLSEYLLDLYAKHGVTSNYEKFLTELLFDENVPFSEKELARIILDKKRSRWQDFNKYKPKAKVRMAVRESFTEEPKDLKNLKQIYAHYYALGGPSETKKEKFSRNDIGFMENLRAHRKDKPGSYDVLRAFDWYRRMFAVDNAYFRNPKFYHFDSFKIDDFEPTANYPQDFTGPIIAGPYTHELSELYDRYRVQPGQWRSFLNNLLNNPRARLRDQELARFVLNKEKKLRRFLDNQQKPQQPRRALSDIQRQPRNVSASFIRAPRLPTAERGTFQKVASRKF